MAKMKIEAVQEEVLEAKIEERTQSLVSDDKVEQLEKMLDFTMTDNQRRAFRKTQSKNENLKFSLCFWGEKLVTNVETLKEYAKDSENPMEREFAVLVSFHDGKTQKMSTSRWLKDPLKLIKQNVECTNIAWAPWQVGINKHGIDPEFILDLPIDGEIQKTRVKVPLHVCNL